MQQSVDSTQAIAESDAIAVERTLAAIAMPIAFSSSGTATTFSGWRTV